MYIFKHITIYFKLIVQLYCIKLYNTVFKTHYLEITGKPSAMFPA